MAEKTSASTWQDKLNKIKTFIYKNLPEIIIFLAFLSLYALTSSHSIIQGDTGDFLSAAATNGVPHDPGYPLYSLISRIVFLLPFGNPAWQVNLLSCLFAALALVFTFKIIKAITNNTPSALFGTLALGTYQSFWYYALAAQIHVLNVLLLSLLFYFLILFIKTKKIFYLYLATFIFGLGVSNSHTIIFTVPSFLIAIFYLRKQLTFRRLFTAGVISLLGLLPYLYLLWAASLHPAVNWGGIYNLSNFISFFFRGSYGTIHWSSPEPWAPFAYSPFVHFFVSIFTTSWYILPFFVISFLYLLKKDVCYQILLSCFILIGPFFYFVMTVPLRTIIHVANSEQFISYPFFFISVLAGLGLGLVLTKYKLKHTLLFSLLVALFFVIPFFYELPQIRLDNNQLTGATIKFQLSEIPKNSILITAYDSPYLPAMYWQHAEGYRRDITIIAYGLFNTAWYRENLKLQHPELGDLLNSPSLNYSKLCQKYAANDKLFISPWYPEFDTFFNEKCKLIPYGLVVKVVPKNQVVNIQALKDFNDSQWSKFTKLLPPLSTFAKDYPRTRETLFRISEQFNYIGTYYLNNNQERWALGTYQKARLISPDEVNSIIGESALLFKNRKNTQAIAILEDGIKRAPAILELYKNLAVIYQKIGNQDKAYQNFQNYLDFNPANDPDLPYIQNFLSSYKNSL